MNATDDFASWLEEVEIKPGDVLPAVEPEPAPVLVAHKDPDTGQLVRAKWDTDNKKLHKCFDCKGSGIWVPSYGRARPGLCHKCNGRGHFKTSIAERKKARDQRKFQQAQKLTDDKADFFEENEGAEAVIEWCRENSDWNDFARSLVSGEWGFDKRGKLSDKQLAAARKMIDKVEAQRKAKAEKAAESAEKAAEDPLDLTPLPKGYYAVPQGETRLKVCVQKPGKDSNWQGWVFVNDGAAYGAGKRYGSQRPGQLYQGDIVDELRAIMADPGAASREYGKLVGRCGVCNRLLEDPDSIEAGIGPICASKTGW